MLQRTPLWLILATAVWLAASAWAVDRIGLASQPGGTTTCREVATSFGSAQRCSHIDQRETADSDAARGAGSATGPTQSDRIPCTPNDGGPVVRVVYAYTGANELDTGPRPVRHALHQMVAGADWILAEAARAAGSTRHVRWHTPGCKLSITPLRYQSGALEAALRSAGLYDEGERGDKLLVFYDSGPSGGNWGCSGAAYSYDDDSPSQTNLNNQLEEYAWVTCSHSSLDGWALAPWIPAEIFAHELFHLLGAVQDSAPHSAGGHAGDTADLMRAILGEGTGEVCEPVIPEPLDCNGDDYFNVSPRPGTYLDRHWNTARSRYLVTRDPAKWITLPRPDLRVRVPAEVDDTGLATVSVSVPPGLRVGSRVELLVNGQAVGSDDSRPYTIAMYLGSLDPPPVSGQRLDATARVFDTYGWTHESAAVRTVYAMPSARIVGLAPYRTVLAGDPLRVTVDARSVGAARLSKVQFLYGREVLATDRRPPFAATLKLSHVVSGLGANTSLVARVTDSKGRTAESAEVPLVVVRPAAYLGVEQGDTFAAGRPVTVPAGIWGYPDGPLRWMSLEGLTIDVLAGKKLVATIPGRTLVRRGPAALALATIAMPPPGEHILSVRVRRGTETLDEWSTNIYTVATNASVEFVSPRPGKAGPTVVAKVRFKGGTPDQRTVEFAVNDGYPVDADGTFAAKLDLGSGIHVITAHFDPGWDSSTFVGPAIIVTTPEFSVSAKIVRRDRRFDDDWLHMRASLNGMRPAWARARGTITWFVNDLQCFEPREFDTIPKPLTGSCRLPAGVDWTGAKIRAVVELGGQDYTPIGSAVSAPVLVK